MTKTFVYYELKDERGNIIFVEKYQDKEMARPFWRYGYTWYNPASNRELNIVKSDLLFHEPKIATLKNIFNSSTLTKLKID